MPLSSFSDRFPLLVSSLLQTKQNDKLAHAYIVYSDSPEVREGFPKAMSQLILCQTPLENGDACGGCRNCDHIERDIYPEIYTLMPTMKTRVIKTGEDHLEPDTIRWFEYQFYLKSATDINTKIGIIYDADRMQANGQNFFLKTLEEPPGKSFFILATGNPSSLLNTIRSRCQTLLLLTNECRYDFTGSDQLLQALNQLQFHSEKNIVAAERHTETIQNLADTLRSIARDKVNQKWAKQLEESKELEPAAQKRIQDRYNGAVQSEYLNYRQYFLSAIHTWCAQIYQLSCRLPQAPISQPSFLDYIDVPTEAIDEKKAYKALIHAEDLLYNLRFNVKEDLAIRNFCLNLAFMT